MTAWLNRAVRAPRAIRGVAGERRNLGLLLVVPLLLLGPILATGRVFLPQLVTALEPFASEAPERARTARVGMNYPQSDRLLPFLTDQIAYREALAEGELLIWEPKFGLGVPFFAQSISGAAYPPNWLGFLFAPERMAGPLAILSLFLAGLGMWLFLGRRGLAPGACALGALAYQLGGWGLANIYYYIKVDAALWLPWAFWAVEGIATRRRWSGAWLSLSIAASLLAGMITIGVYVAGLTGVYAVLRLTRLARPLGLVGDSSDESLTVRSPDQGGPRAPNVMLAWLFVALGSLGASVLLLPTVEASRLSDRKTVSPAGVEAMSLPVQTTLGTVVCDLFGLPTEDTRPGRLPAAWWLTPAEDAGKAEAANQLEWNTYAGAAVVLLALVALVSVPRRALAPALLLVWAFAFAQGWPVVRWLYALPGLNVGAPGRVLGLAWMLWPWLAALGTDAWIRRAPRAQGALFGLAFAACVAAFLGWTRLEPEAWAHGVENTLVERYGESHGVTLAEVRARLPFEKTVAAGERIHVSLGLLVGATLATLAAGALGVVFGRPRAAFGGRFPAGRTKGLTNGLTIGLAIGLALVLGLAVVPAFERSFSAEFGAPPVLLAAAGTLALALLAVYRRGGDEGATQEAARWLPLLVVVLAEGLVASHGHVTGRVLEDGPFPPSETIDAIARAAGDGRVIRFDASESGLDDVLALARPSMLLPYGIADVTPWIGFPPHTYNELFAALDPRSRRNQGVACLTDASVLGHPILDLTRVTAVLSRNPLEHPRLEPVLARPGFHVYHRSGALPPARLVAEAIAATSDEAALATLASGAIDLERQTLLAPEHAALVAASPPAGRRGELVRFECPTRTRRVAEVRGSEGAWLVVQEQHYPGWQVRVNGERAELLRAEHVDMAVRVPPGDSVIEFRYAPGSLRIGIALTALAAVAALVVSRRMGT